MHVVMTRKEITAEIHLTHEERQRLITVFNYFLRLDSERYKTDETEKFVRELLSKISP